MSEVKTELIETKVKPATIWAYASGFILSVALTVLAYLFVQQQWLAGTILVYAIIGLGLVQMAVQLFFFLHMGQEAKPHWNLQFLLITASIIFMVVIGSIWIMYHLNYLMMPSEMNNYLMQEENIFK
jgi:cytochrome o ubiquinol oxidase operon protein cyoD